MLDIRSDAEAILNSIGGFLLIDNKERIVFMCKSLIEAVGLDSLEQVKGKRLRDVIACNMTYRVLETGKRQIGVSYHVPNGTITSNSYPIYRNGVLIGALEYDVFEDETLLHDFFEKRSAKKMSRPPGDARRDTRRHERYSPDNIKGSGAVIRKLKNDIRLCAKSDSTVLISGETGTGKEMIARAIHAASRRRAFEFIELNCATIPGDLFESELFGYEEGSFTGAKKGGKPGLAELADRGILFLDEINALPIHMQAKLLRFLQEKEIRRLGGGLSKPVDVRVIAATNECPVTLVRQGRFRQDLYYRLNVLEIVAEPLRNRKGDIPELARCFIDSLNAVLEGDPERREVLSIDKDAMERLLDYDWPGNVRELRNVLERAMNRCLGPTLTPAHFDDFPARDPAVLVPGVCERVLVPGACERVLVPACPDRPVGGACERAADTAPSETDAGSASLREIKRDTEIRAIHDLLYVQGLSRKDAAASLGISRQMLHRKIKKYGLDAAREGDR
ncbi:MAG: sigma 54-interacting transcriptional regulator [Clostridiales Family XIII bacterium]|jgi:transcriptional regulator with PAS, ATPase and Fis domain|nr:sigma 54-interacting transcriptional regulator [Clostridiales Family XIII bacterium]